VFRESTYPSPDRVQRDASGPGVRLQPPGPETELEPTRAEHLERGRLAAQRHSGSRPPLSASTEAASRASPAGCRRSWLSTAVPIRTRGADRAAVVSAGIGAKRVKWMPLRSRWSEQSTRSYPRSSALRTADT